jgi:MoxR-like ATPase
VRGNYFEYLLTRFSEPNEVFGPIDLVRLREGTVATVTTRMLPEGEFVFLDELFNANSAILNNLLTVLNERVYRRGAEVHQLPLLSLFAASNHLPEDEALRALFDRFLLRCHVDNLNRDLMPRLLIAGWDLEQSGPLESSISAADLRELSRKVYRIELASIAERYADVVSKVRDLGVTFSDRRAVKVLKLVAASALLCGRTVASVADFWVFRYVWDREEQVAPLAALVAGVIEPHSQEPDLHPLAVVPDRASGEEIARQLDSVAVEIQNKSPGLAAIARFREQLSTLSDSTAWLADEPTRRHLVDRIGELLRRLG